MYGFSIIVQQNGLKTNIITFTDKLFSFFFSRPNLLSLDLSHNNLSDLLDVIRKLGSLPKLRNLILQGNPLSVCLFWVLILVLAL